MTLWKLEIARLVRTHRWLILFGAYGFFGALGPLTARYIREIMARFGGDEFIVAVKDPTPAEGMAQFVSNASQLGLLAVVVVAAAALAFDARPELAAFLRTRVLRASMLVIPRYVITTAAAVGALVAGSVIAATLTAALIGPVPVGPLVLGTAYGAAYLGFAVAVVAAVASWARSVVTTVFAALAILIVLPVAGMVDTISTWLPTSLLGALPAMVDGEAAPEYLPALAVSVAVTAGLLAVALRRAAAREL
jgi:ABC-2 type transport system permease protein